KGGRIVFRSPRHARPLFQMWVGVNFASIKQLMYGGITKRLDNGIHLSASDLIGHARCRHLTVLDLAVTQSSLANRAGGTRCWRSFRNGAVAMKPPMSSTCRDSAFLLSRYRASTARQTLSNRPPK